MFVGQAPRRNSTSIVIYPCQAVHPDSFRVYDGDGVECAGPLVMEIQENCIVDLRDHDSVTRFRYFCRSSRPRSFQDICGATPELCDKPVPGFYAILVGEFLCDRQYTIKYRGVRRPISNVKILMLMMCINITLRVCRALRILPPLCSCM